jgi:hypothetical protein
VLGGWNDAIRFGHGGVELSCRLWRLAPDPARQIYHPGPVLGHDYVADEAALERKRERQARAKSFVKALHPDVCAFLGMWKEFKSRTDLVRERAEDAEGPQGQGERPDWDRAPRRLIEAVRVVDAG